MLRRLSATVPAALLLIALAVPVQAADAQRGRHETIIAHWTPARLAAAVPRDFTRGAEGRFTPSAKPDKPPGKPGGGGGDGSVTGASWTGGGQVLQASGKVYFEMGSGAYVCSGAVAEDSRSGYSLVLTAAHCALDETSGEFAENWLFIPNFDGAPTFSCAQTVHGCWTASALVVHHGYATAGGFNTQATLHDFAFAVVGPGGKSGSAQLDATVGSFDLTFSAVAPGTSAYAFGYPAAQKYKGKDLTYCAGPVGTDPYNDDLTYALACTMTGGSSGGPWLTDFDEESGVGTLSSVNSYGYSGVKAMHGPMFGAKTQAVWDAADGATSNTIATGG
jgi:V8-like Glu-specific endopeptidase